MAPSTTQSGTQAPRTLIVGLGETGYSVARFLAGRGMPIAGTDSRLQPPALERLRGAAQWKAAGRGWQGKFDS